MSVNNIKVDHRVLGWYGMDLIEVSCEHSNEPLGSRKCWEILGCLHTGTFSRWPQFHRVIVLMSFHFRTGE
jgi:hypothetical protein